MESRREKIFKKKNRIPQGTRFLWVIFKKKYINQHSVHIFVNNDWYNSLNCIFPFSFAHIINVDK